MFKVQYVRSLFLLLLLAATFLPGGLMAAHQIVLDWEEDANGSPILAGQVIDDEFHSTTGISVTVATSSAYNGDIAGIFPSSAPPIDTHNQVIDPDLGSPNESCPGGGPGIGAGGTVGQPGENCVSQGNALIFPTSPDGDGDGFFDDLPNDDIRAGTAYFIFSRPVTVDFIEVMDQDPGERLTVRVYADRSGTELLETVSGSVLGDNGLEQIVINVTRARRLEMERTGSGAIAAIAFTPEEPTAVRLAAIRITGESGGAFGFVLALVGLLLVTLILLLRRVVD